jgi:hypothetical protein
MVLKEGASTQKSAVVSHEKKKLFKWLAVGLQSRALLDTSTDNFKSSVMQAIGSWDAHASHARCAGANNAMGRICRSSVR